MQLREVSAQVDTGSQDKQMQLGCSAAATPSTSSTPGTALAEGELSKLAGLQQAKFELLQFDSAVARLRTESSGYEVDQKTSLNRHEALAGEQKLACEQGVAAAAAAPRPRFASRRPSRPHRGHEGVAEAQQAVAP